jgi:hypothetical protein
MEIVTIQLVTSLNNTKDGNKIIKIQKKTTYLIKVNENEKLPVVQYQMFQLR